jgi:acyl-CoA dehydrogenase
MPNIARWEKKQEIPREAYKTCYEYGIYAARYPKHLGGTPFEDKPFDPFMDLIMREEIARTCCCAITTAIMIHTIAIPPAMHYGNEHVRKLYAPTVTADKLVALAISENAYGSDVANIGCTAVKSPCGKFYIVNGDKKWISNGMKAELFTTLVRTGTKEQRHKGCSLLAIERGPGLVASRIPTQGHWPSQTTQLFFKDVKVPVENLIGEEGQGFYLTMRNFNQERFSIACNAASLARQALLEAVKYARTRVVFGKKLIEAQVIRHKCAEMARQIMASYALLEKVAYQMIEDPMGERDPSVGANMALAKVQATKTMEFCAREASQILGGKSYVLGSKVDMIYRDVRALAIYGGSEEIMLDVSTRLARL